MKQLIVKNKIGYSKSYMLILTAFIFQLLSQNIIAQKTSYQWFNPAESSFPVIDGRGWHKELAHPYDRLPAKAEAVVREPLWRLAQNTAGEYIGFKTSATSIVVRYKVTGSHAMNHMPATGVTGVDLYARDINGQWQWARGSCSFGDTIEYRFNNLSLSSKVEEFRLYLPLYNSVSWMNIGVPQQETFTALPVGNEQPIIMYGTSIMQGGCASRPGLAFSNILSRKLDYPIINLGFSGNGQLEMPLIDLMNEHNAKLFVLDCMPNLADRNKFSSSEIQRRILESVKSLQQKHASTPILLTEYSCGLPGIEMDTTLQKTNKWTSDVLDQTFDTMLKSGIKNIYLLKDNAIDFDEESTVDGSHPNDIGMMKYADAYEKIIREILKEPKGKISTTLPVRQRRDNATYDFMQRHEAVLQTVKEQQPEVILIGNSIINYWGGKPEAPIKKGASAWNKYFEPLNTVNLGYGWDRIENVLWRVYHGELDGYNAKQIVLTIGTNNLSIGDSDENIVEGLRFLAQAIQQRQPSATLFLSGIYPRKNQEKRIDVLNKKIAAMAAKMKIKFINPGTTLLKKDKSIDESLFTDGLHPNETGYEKLGLVISRLLNSEKK